MAIRTPFASGEWYHCFNRGVDKRITFESQKDYERFLQVLYICNSIEKIHRSDLISSSTEKILFSPRNKPLVEIGAFCLMPNHFHLLLKESEPNGITSFMQRIGTAYTMYFNIKNKRTGNLFMKPFKSKHVGEDLYFQHVINYIHCNPAEIFEHGWKNGEIKDTEKMHKKLLSYPYSSFAAYHDTSNILRAILSDNVFTIAKNTDPATMVNEALEYYEYTGKATP